MKNRLWVILSSCIISLFFFSCGEKRDSVEKGFEILRSGHDKVEMISGYSNDTLDFLTRPGDILMTGHPQYRLTPVYKVNYNKDSTLFTGSNSLYYDYSEEYGRNNNWNHHLMPGMSAVYGFNMVNISLFDHVSQTPVSLFDRPVLIRTLYYPSFATDTLQGKPVLRNHYMVSVHDEDTNKDGYLRTSDLRKFYVFDITGKNKTALLPEHYSVFKSIYDPVNDCMYAYTRYDRNGNGAIEKEEPEHIFRINLKDPLNNGRVY